MIWPFIIYFFTKRSLSLFIVFVLLAAMPLRYFLGELLLSIGREPLAVGNNIYWFTFAQIDSLILGAFVAFFNILDKVKKPQNWFYLALALFLIVGFLNSMVAGEHGIHFPLNSLGYLVESIVNYQHVWSYTIINITAAALMVWGIHREVNQGLPLPLLSHPVMVRIGKISYGIYVFHVPVMYIVTILTGHPEFGFTGFKLLNMFLYLSLTYLISELSYRYFESVFLKLKKVTV